MLPPFFRALALVIETIHHNKGPTGETFPPSYRAMPLLSVVIYHDKRPTEKQEVGRVGLGPILQEELETSINHWIYWTFLCSFDNIRLFIFFPNIFRLNYENNILKKMLKLSGAARFLCCKGSFENKNWLSSCCEQTVLHLVVFMPKLLCYFCKTRQKYILVKCVCYLNSQLQYH